MTRFKTAIASVLATVVATLAPSDERPRGPDLFAITGARVVTGTGDVLENGTVVLDNGLITAVGTSVDVPPTAWVIDGTGKVVYPGLVDALSNVGLASSENANETEESEFATGPEDRPATTPWRSAADELALADDRIESWREAGFTSAVTAPQDGIVSGLATFINLAGERERDLVVAPGVAIRVNLESPGSNRSFPGSLMGVIAYVKQLFADAAHHRASWAAYEESPLGKERPRYDRALEPLSRAQVERTPVLLPGHWEHEIVRAVRLAKELDVEPVVYGLHQGHAAAELLAAENVAALVSVHWPERDEDADPEEEEPLRVLRMRDEAPGTPAALEKAGVTFAFYSDGLEDTEEILEGVRTALARGLSRDAAIRALTMAPATIFGVADRLGSLEEGKIANLIVATGDLFDESTRVETVFIDGVKFEIREDPDEGEES